MRTSRSMLRLARTYSRWVTWRSRARALSFAATKASGSPTSAIDGAPARSRLVTGRATGDQRSRRRRDLRESRARTCPDLSDDKRRQLRAGGDGDLHDLHRLDDHGPRRLLLAGVRPHALDRLRRRSHGRARAHPSGRAPSRARDRDPHDRDVDRDQRPHRLDLGTPAEGVRPPVPQPRGGRRGRVDLDPGHRHLLHLPRHRHRALAVLPVHDARARDAVGRLQSECQPVDGSSCRLDACAGLGLRGCPRRSRGDDGRADGLPRPRHDARRLDLRIRRGRARRNRQSGWRGCRRPPAGRRDQPARELRRLRRPGAQIADRPGRAPARARHSADGSLRSRRGEEGLMRRWAAPTLQGLVLAAAVVLLAVMPWVTREFRLGQFTYVGIYFIALLGLNILPGYNGQISLGHAAFMAIGGYTATILILGQQGFELAGHDPSHVIPEHGMRPLFTIPIAGLVAGVIGYLFGLPALRLAAVSLALATLAVAVSFPALAKRFEHLTGGGGGLSLPLPQAPFGWDISTPHWLYYEVWVTAAILFVVAWLLVRGRVGRAWRAIRDGEVAAVSSGVSPAVYKTLAFGISAAYAGVAGALFVIQVSYINPDTFPIGLSILLLVSVVLGGLGSLLGGIFGALLLEFLPIYAQQPPVVDFSFSKQAPSVVFGVVLILMVLVAPGGVAGLLRQVVQPIRIGLARRGSRPSRLAKEE